MINPLSDDLAGVREVWRGKVEQAKRTETCKNLLRRRYRNPHGYLEWERCAAELSAVTDTLAQDFNALPWAPKILTALSAGFCLDQGPIYWLRESLAQALWHSDLPAQLPELKQSVKRSLILFPHAQWLADPDGFIPRYVIVQHLLKGEPLAPLFLRDLKIDLVGPPHDQIQWATPLPTGGAYAQSSSLLGNELESKPNTIEPDSQTTDAEHQWLGRITQLIYQCLLLLQLKPDFIDESTVASSTGKTKKKLTRKERLLDPRWLGTGFEIRTTRNREPSSGTHASPMTHWRRGHWKRVAVGEGRKERKIVWIQPTLVNP